MTTLVTLIEKELDGKKPATKKATVATNGSSSTAKGKVSFFSDLIAINFRRSDLAITAKSDRRRIQHLESVDASGQEGETIALVRGCQFFQLFSLFSLIAMCFYSTRLRFASL